jgi:hypothetical protein
LIAQTSPNFKEFAMVGAGASGRGPQITAEEAAELEKARERMIARHKLIEAMIRNNELQLKNESARGGAEIERACALRDAATPKTEAVPEPAGRLLERASNDAPRGMIA